GFVQEKARRVDVRVKNQDVFHQPLIAAILAGTNPGEQQEYPGATHGEEYTTSRLYRRTGRLADWAQASAGGVRVGLLIMKEFPPRIRCRGYLLGLRVRGLLRIGQESALRPREDPDAVVLTR